MDSCDHNFKLTRCVAPAANLHHWVDLVFGYKQRPPHMPNGSDDAVAACNVYRFYHYPDAYSMDEVGPFGR